MFSVYLVPTISMVGISTLETGFCFVCRHFAPSRSRKDSEFVTTGIRRWKKAHDSDAGFK